MADTNVLVAAAITPDGVCGRLLTEALNGRWQLVASPQLLGELGAVLARDKFRRWLTVDEAARFVGDVSALADTVADPPVTAEPQTTDPDDEFLLNLAGVARVVALISGDPHLTVLTDWTPPVLTPADFLDWLARREGR